MPTSQSLWCCTLCTVMDCRGRTFSRHLSPLCSCAALLSDGSEKTATGTICIEVVDAKDYCPVIYSERNIVCTNSPSVLIYVSDSSYGSPFTFCVLDQSPETTPVWDIRSINGEWNVPAPHALYPKAKPCPTDQPSHWITLPASFPVSSAMFTLTGTRKDFLKRLGYWGDFLD